MENKKRLVGFKPDQPFLIFHLLRVYFLFCRILYFIDYQRFNLPPQYLEDNFI